MLRQARNSKPRRRRHSGMPMPNAWWKRPRPSGARTWPRRAPEAPGGQEPRPGHRRRHRADQQPRRAGARAGRECLDVGKNFDSRSRTEQAIKEYDRAVRLLEVVPGGHKDLASARQRLAELKGGSSSVHRTRRTPSDAPHDTVDRRPGGHLRVIDLGCAGPEGRQQTHATSPGRPAGCGSSPPGPASGDQRMTLSTGFAVDYPKKDWQTSRRRGILVRGPVSQITRSGRRDREDESMGAPGAQRNQRSDRHSRDRRLAAAPAARDGVFTSVRGFPRPAKSILIDFTQPGSQGPEHVRLYTLPRGTDWVPGDLHDHPAHVRQIQRDLSTHRAQRDAVGSGTAQETCATEKEEVRTARLGCMTDPGNSDATSCWSASGRARSVCCIAPAIPSSAARSRSR